MRRESRHVCTYIRLGTVSYKSLANDLIRNHDEGAHGRGAHPMVAETWLAWLAWHLADRIHTLCALYPSRTSSGPGSLWSVLAAWTWTSLHCGAAGDDGASWHRPGPCRVEAGPSSDGLPVWRVGRFVGEAWRYSPYVHKNPSGTIRGH